MAHQLPPLPYDYSALEPYIDTQTMKLHHDMHHGTYVKNLNAALEKYPKLQSQAAEDLLRDLNAVPEHHVLENYEAERWRRAQRPHRRSVQEDFRQLQRFSNEIQ